MLVASFLLRNFTRPFLPYLVVGNLDGNIYTLWMFFPNVILILPLSLFSIYAHCRWRLYWIRKILHWRNFLMRMKLFKNAKLLMAALSICNALFIFTFFPYLLVSRCTVCQWVIDVRTMFSGERLLTGFCMMWHYALIIWL